MTHIRYHIITLLLTISLSIQTSIAQEVKGYVFYDDNRNGVMDSKEKGVKGVPVSNQDNVIVTNKDGFFNIDLDGNDFLVVTKQSNFQFPVDQYNSPKNYYRYKPNGSPTYMRYAGVAATGQLPEILYFPVYKTNAQQTEKALIIGDPQMADTKRLNYLRDGQIPLMAKQNADFFIVLGDIADKDLGILPYERELMKHLGIPGYRVIGNHDLDFSSRNNFDASEAFKAIYGPVDYSFEYNNHHFIILNNIQYEGYNQNGKKYGPYFGGLTAQQLRWIANDLKYTDSKKTIVVATHIPFLKEYTRQGTIDSLIQTLNNCKNILFLSGHLHTIKAYNIDLNDKKIDGLSAGATCGSWWSGPYTELGLPYATCMDGSPQGFFTFNFSMKGYTKTLIPAHYPESYQMHIDLTNDDEEQNKTLVVNWFTGKPDEKVYAIINNNQISVLQNFTGISNWIEQTIRLRSNPDQWTPRPEETDHLWKTTLKSDLFNVGLNKIEIIAENAQGDKINTLYFYSK